MNAKHIRLGFAIILAAFHLIVSMALAIIGDSISSINSEFVMIMVMAISFVQCSLLATWAVLGSGPYWLRIPMSFLLLIWSEFCFLRVMDSGMEPELIVSMAIAISLQYFSIVASIILIQISLKLLKMESYLDTTTRFSMGTLMIVTTLIAVAVGIGKFVIQQVLQVSWESLSDLEDDFWIFPFLSIFNTLAVVFILPALWCQRWQLKLILMIPLCLLVSVIGIIETPLFFYLFSERTPFYIFLWINLGQSFIFFATMFPLWRWSDQAKGEVGKEPDPMATSPEASSPF
ncbi:MAG: hypothetical protein ACKVH8_19150 [Pirellulales bacterium]